MTLSEYFAFERGRQITLARTLGIPQANVSRWADGTNPAPAELGADIERATGGQVTRQELFPESWARIWPELAAPATDLPGKISGDSTIDHAAELRGAIAQTRLVFEGHRDAQDALEYLEQVLKAGQRAEVPAHACTPAAHDQTEIEPARLTVREAAKNLLKWIESKHRPPQHDHFGTMALVRLNALATLADAVANEELRGVEPPPRDNSALAQIKRELFTTADQLQQPVDLTVQLMLLAELRMLKDYARVAEASSQSCIRHS